MAGGLSGRQVDGVGVVHKGRVVVLPVGLLFQTSTTGLRGGTTWGSKRGAQCKPGSCFVQLRVNIIIDM